MSESYQDFVTEDARLVILRALASEGDYRLNERLLTATLDRFGHRRSREWVRTQLRKLEELGAVRLTEAGTVLIAELTRVGIDHVERRAFLEGVLRPLAGGLSMAKPVGRGRLSSIDLLPGECDAVVAWAAEQLMRREETQLSLYAQFREKLIAIQGETGAAFDVPSFSSFNRFAIGKAVMGRRLEQTREIAKALSERLDHETSDELTTIAAETIKTLIFELLQAKGEAGITPKGAMELANALRAATAAQQLSTARRQKVDQEFADKVDEAIEEVSKETGLSAEAAAKIRRDILGVRA